MKAKRQRRAYTTTLRHLRTLPMVPVVAPSILAAANTDSGREYVNAMDAAGKLRTEIAAVIAVRDAVVDLPSSQVPSGSVL